MIKVREGVYMKFHFGQNEIFSFWYLVNYLQLLEPEMKFLRVSFHCGHPDRHEISFRI